MRPHYLTVIQGGLRPGETRVSKLISRPYDYPDLVFQQLCFELDEIPLEQFIELQKMRDAVLRERAMAEDACTLEAAALGYREIPRFLLSPKTDGHPPSPP